ncbi:MAG: general secretion pathway protein GspK [Synergistaceae bacterium]|nr:general secretion pathway protein GspK [Synergistaceae bacterium]
MCSPSLSKSKREGFVLVSALLLGLVFISCAVAFAWFSRLQVKGALRERTTLESRSLARVLAQAVISALRATGSGYDSLTQPWFQPFLFPAEGLGTWGVRLTPLDDKIPMRSIFLPDGNTLRSELREMWTALWEKLEKRELSILVLDFMDRDARPRVGGAEREGHLNRLLLDMSELLLLEEMTPGLLYGEGGKLGVADYATLWSGGQINLNVAPVHVMELLPGLNRTLAENIAAYREREALRGIGSLRAVPGFPTRATPVLRNLAAFGSRYFSITIEPLDAEEMGVNVRFQIVFDKTSGGIVRWEEF